MICFWCRLYPRTITGSATLMSILRTVFRPDGLLSVSPIDYKPWKTLQRSTAPVDVRYRLILTSGPKCELSTWRRSLASMAIAPCVGVKALRLNFPNVLNYLNTTRSLDIRRRLQQISYHQTEGQIVISHTNTSGITRIYRDEKLLGFACLMHLGDAF